MLPCSCQLHMSSPLNIKEICETSKLLYNSLNLTEFISDPTQKLVELAHLTKSGRRDYEGGHLEPRTSHLNSRETVIVAVEVVVAIRSEH